MGYPNRPLTPAEQALHNKGLCFICGQPLTYASAMECKLCWQERTRLPYGVCGLQRKLEQADGKANMHQQSMRQLGYGACESSPELRGEDDE
jgi:predicted amidophosphoribosyltransferase